MFDIKDLIKRLSIKHRKECREPMSEADFKELVLLLFTEDEMLSQYKWLESFWNDYHFKYYKPVLAVWELQGE